MNVIVRSKVIRLQKGTFTVDKTGEVRSYAKVTIVDSNKNEEDDIGTVFSTIGVDPSLFNSLKDLLNKQLDVDFNIEITTSNDGTVRRKIVSFKETGK